MSSMLKKFMPKFKSTAELEAFLKEGFSVPASKPVALTFKTAADQLQYKKRFWSEMFKEQLSLAVAVLLDDA